MSVEPDNKIGIMTCIFLLPFSNNVFLLDVIKFPSEIKGGGGRRGGRSDPSP